MKIKKYLISLICVIALMSIMIIPASALSATFSMTADYDNLKIGDTFNVVVAVNNIKEETGIILVTYFVDYDIDCFEIVEWVQNKPTIWGDDYEEYSAVNIKDGMHRFEGSYMYGGGEHGHGVLGNDILFTTITFKVLSNNANGKILSLYDTGFQDDNTEDFFCNEASLIINLQGEPVVSQGDIAVFNNLNNSNVSNTSNITSDGSNNIDSSSIVASENSSNINSSFDDSSDDKPVNISNLCKIIIAIIVVVIIISIGFIINKRLRTRK